MYIHIYIYIYMCVFTREHKLLIVTAIYEEDRLPDVSPRFWLSGSDAFGRFY